MKKILALFLLLYTQLFSQTLVYNLSRIAGGYAKGYVQPLVNAFGADINSGFYSVTTSDNNKFSFQFGIKLFTAKIPNSDMTFSGKFDDIAYYRIGAIDYPVRAEVTVNNAPTVFGSNTPAIAQIDLKDTVWFGAIAYPISETRFQETIGGVIKSEFRPIGVPEIVVGKLFGTEVIVRWLPNINLSGYGSTGFWGLGIKHNLASYLTFLPFDASVQFLYQDFSMKDSADNKYISSSSKALNLTLSKELGIITFYGGLQYETYDVTVDYTYTPPPNSQGNPVKINFKTYGENEGRAFLGTSLKLSLFNLYIDYSIANYNVLSGGIILKI